jgi:branched-chain amino acid transport system ATP-binding protein
MAVPDAKPLTVDGQAPADTVLAVTDLEVVYGQHIPALRGVSLGVGAGEVVALLGANGAGKTSMLRSITGLLRFHDAAITRGRILFRGQDVTHAPPATIVRAGAAQVMEGGRVFDEMTVADNLATGAVVLSDRRAMAARREEMYALFPVLGERRSWQAGYLSGGEQQMLAIGRALMSSPTFLLLDEPSLGLAPLVVEEIRDVIAEISRQGTTVLLVEQNASMALSMSDRTYILQNGAIAVHGPSAELKDDRRVRELYLGVDAEGGRRSYRAARAGASSHE